VLCVIVLCILCTPWLFSPQITRHPAKKPIELFGISGGTGGGMVCFDKVMAGIGLLADHPGSDQAVRCVMLCRRLGEVCYAMQAVR
jgi:hypothetical protein